MTHPALQRLGEPPTIGEVVDVRQDRTYGWVAEVQLLHGADRRTDARLVFPSDAYAPIAKGDRVLVHFLDGRADQAIATPQVAMGGDAKPPTEWVSDQSRARLLYGLTEVRAAGGDDVEGVVTRALLDDLSDLVGALQALTASITGLPPGLPPGTAAQNAAILTAMQTAIQLPLVGVDAKLSAVKSALDTAKAGQGTGPHCSTVLRAKAGS